MVKKIQKSPASDVSAVADAPVKAARSGSPLAAAIKEASEQIWLAGLGAYAKAQQEGGKVFEALVQEGLSLQRKTQAAAEEKITDVTQRMSGMAHDLTTRASGQWDKLESIFEERVSRTLSKLGVPTARDIEALMARIDELNANVQKLQRSSAAAAPKASARKASTDSADADADQEARRSATAARRRAAAARRRTAAAASKSASDAA